MPSPARIFPRLAALAAAGALCAWLLAPEAARLAPTLASWTAWKQAKNMELDGARAALDAASGAAERLAGITGFGARVGAPFSGAAPADRDRLAWDAATLDALSGAWQDAAEGFARAAMSGSAIPKDAAYAQLGTALYRLGERDLDGPARLGAWALSVESYGKSLAEKFDRTTWENREFVREKLREEARKRAQEERGSGGQGEAGGPQPSADDLRSLEQQMRDAARRDQELRKWLRPDGRKPAAPRLPSELLRELMGGGEGGTGDGEKKDW